MTRPAAQFGQALTPHQLNVAVFIHTYHAVNDNMPSHAEVAQAFGVRPNAAFEAVQRLKHCGVFEPAENFSKYRFARTHTGTAYRAQITTKRIEQGGAA